MRGTEAAARQTVPMWPMRSHIVSAANMPGRQVAIVPIHIHIFWSSNSTLSIYLVICCSLLYTFLWLFLCLRRGDRHYVSRSSVRPSVRPSSIWVVESYTSGTENWLGHFAHPSPKFYRGSNLWNLASIFHRSGPQSVQKKRDQNIFCNISYKTRAIVMKLSV